MNQLKLKPFITTLLIALALGLGLVPPAFATDPCQGALSANVDQNELRAQALQHFRLSPRLVYADETQANEESAFYHSNEFDWHSMEPDYEPTDVVIGFGTNNAWDLAVRKNAKLLVIADWLEGPIQTQEILMRPLILGAKSPGDFISLIAGVPIPDAIRDSPLSNVFYFIDHQLKTPADILKSRQNFIKHRLHEFKKSNLINKKEELFLWSYYEDLFQKAGTNPPKKSSGFGPITGQRAADFLSISYLYFKNRYYPERLHVNGADPLKTGNPYFSFLSSQQAFHRLKKLFKNSVHFAVSSVEDRQLYEKVHQLATSKGLKKYTISTVNIFYCMSRAICSNSGYLRDFLQWTVPLFATSENPLVVYQTRGMERPHRFDILTLRSTNDIETEMARYHYEEPTLNGVNQTQAYDYIIKSLSQGVTSAFYSSSAKIFQITFGDSLEVYVNQGQISMIPIGVTRVINGGILRPTNDLNLRISEQRRLVVDAFKKAVIDNAPQFSPLLELVPQLEALTYKRDQ